MNLELLIERWEKKKELSPMAASIYSECISDLKMVITGELRSGNTLDSICHFKKHKGKFWKQVIEQDPDYVDWCLGNIIGFILDETAHAYLVEKQNL